MKNKTLQKIIVGLLSILMVVFGLNKFIGFIPVDPPEDPVAQQFMGAMFTSYLSKVVAVAEIAGGVMIMVPRLKLVGYLLLLPVIFNIVAFHIAHDFIGNGIWLLPTALFLVISYFERDRLSSLLVK